MKLFKLICTADEKTKYGMFIPSKELIYRSAVFVAETKNFYAVLKNRTGVDVTAIEFEKLNRSMYSSWEDWKNYKPQEKELNICFDISDRV